MNKQIEELAEELLFYTIIPNDELCDEVAEYIITAGYRKQEDVARDIFAEIEIQLNEFDGSWENTVINTQCLIAELKKKYGV